MMLYPWLLDIYQHLAKDDLRGHAFLILGAVGLGQEELIDQILIYHLQTEHLLDHPDVYRVARLEGKRDISVEQIRQLLQWSQQTAHGHLGRWIVIEELELMNASAANSLLKTLEEPPQGIRFLLTAQRAGKLLPTILSRCQQWTIASPSMEIAIDWLSNQLSVSADECRFALTLHNHAPLKARDWLTGDGLLSWRKWQALWKQCESTRTISNELIQWANEDLERFFSLLSAQCYVSLQDEKTQCLPIIQLCWHAQKLLRQNASKELLVDQVLQAVAQTLQSREPTIRLNHRRGLL